MFNLIPIVDILLRGVLLSAVGLFWVVMLIRIIGTRTLSKITTFDFLVTLSSASLLATAGASSTWQQFAQALIAITTLMGVQYGLALARFRYPMVKRLLENEPVLLVRDGILLRGAMHSARVQESDIMAKLREGNAQSLSDVRAVILETTGDLSVMTCQPSEQVLEGVSAPPLQGARTQ